MKFVKDLLKGPGNLWWDLARVLALWGALMMLGGQAWNMWLGLPLELGPTGLGGGLAALYTAIAAFVWAKDKSGSDARLTMAVAHNVEEDCPPAKKPKPKRRRK